MHLAEVVGTVVASVKDPSLRARTLLVIQPVAPGGGASGAPLVAVDGIGVGVGERVVYARGREASFAFLPDSVLADASIVGRVDAIDVSAAVEKRREPHSRSSRKK